VWGGVRYKDLYPGIDLELSSQNGQWNWRLMVAPGAELSVVRLRAEGAESLTTSKGDNLLFTTAAGQIVFPLLAVNMVDIGQTKIVHTGVRIFEILAPFTSSLVSSDTVATAIMDSNL